MTNTVITARAMDIEIIAAACWLDCSALLRRSSPAPSPDCPSDESLYIIRMTDSGADGWEGMVYRIAAFVCASIKLCSELLRPVLCLVVGSFRVRVKIHKSAFRTGAEGCP